MKRFSVGALLSFITISLLTANAAATASASARYLLQVASNLACQPLQIDIASTTSQQTHTLNYTNNAFSIVELMPDTYQFEEIRCVSGLHNVNALNQSLSKLAPLTLSEKKIYFGGKLILKLKTEAEDTEPDVITNCSRNTSRARGETSNECRDGQGINTSIKANQQILLYAPVLNTNEIDTVRHALNKSTEQLVYLPLVK